MKQYLLDSGFLYGYIDASDQHHEAISAIFAEMKLPIILPVPAITEIAYFIKRNLGLRALADFLTELPKTNFILETTHPSDLVRSAEILRKYNDVNIDFVDACIVAMAERLNITKILTVDRRHFSIFKPEHCASFEIYHKL